MKGAKGSLARGIRGAGDHTLVPWVQDRHGPPDAADVVMGAGREALAVGAAMGHHRRLFDVPTVVVTERRRRRGREYDTDEIRARLHERFAALDTEQRRT
jgi:hypothetical protein